MMPDFSRYSLALLKDGKIIFSSDKKGLRPLVECVDKYKLKGCILHDKVIGLAAARLIVYSGMIHSVLAGIVSKKARDLLEENHIGVTADMVVEKILDQKRKDTCPMERKAEEMTDNQEFFLDLKKTLYL